MKFSQMPYLPKIAILLSLTPLIFMTGCGAIKLAPSDVEKISKSTPSQGMILIAENTQTLSTGAKILAAIKVAKSLDTSGYDKTDFMIYLADGTALVSCSFNMQPPGTYNAEARSGFLGSKPFTYTIEANKVTLVSPQITKTVSVSEIDISTQVLPATPWPAAGCSELIDTRSASSKNGFDLRPSSNASK